MTKGSDFWAQYKTTHWQQKSAAIKERDGWKCVWCNESNEALQAHHLYYLPGKAPWDHPDEALITVCGRCHDRVTAASKAAADKVRGMHPDEAEINAARIGDPSYEVWREMLGAMTVVSAPGTIEAAITEVQKYALTKDAYGRWAFGGQDVTDVVTHMIDSMRRYCAKEIT